MALCAFCQNSFVSASCELVRSNAFSSYLLKFRKFSRNSGILKSAENPENFPEFRNSEISRKSGKFSVIRKTFPDFFLTVWHFPRFPISLRKGKRENMTRQRKRKGVPAECGSSEMKRKSFQSIKLSTSQLSTQRPRASSRWRPAVGNYDRNYEK